MANERLRLRPLPLWAWLAFVAVVGLIGGVAANIATEKRRALYQARVESYAFGEADIIELIAEHLQNARLAEASDNGPEGRRRAGALRDEAERLAKLAAWHVKMERKYARAANHPWEPQSPDLPPP